MEENVLIQVERNLPCLQIVSQISGRTAIDYTIASSPPPPRNC